MILEGEEAKEVRRKAWQLLKEAAGHINRRSDWNPDGFFGSMNQLISIFPQIKE